MVKTKTSLHHLTIACLYIDRKRQHPMMGIAFLYDIKRNFISHSVAYTPVRQEYSYMQDG